MAESQKPLFNYGLKVYSYFYF